MRHEDITIILGVDAKHLEELRLVWPTWMRFKPELKRMPCVVFYDYTQVKEGDMKFLKEHPAVRFAPWQMTNAENQREKMLTGFVKLPAAEVKTPWYLKVDTDVIATDSGEWIKNEWFLPDDHGRTPVFIAVPWGYTKPRNLMEMLDDWADRVPELAKYPRLNLPYGDQGNVLRHHRITSWLFFGRTDWTQKVAAFLGPDGRLPYPSQDSFMFYCAKRLRCYYVRVGLKKLGWDHRRVRRLRLEQETPKDIEIKESQQSRGVIYYNRGTGCTVRLLVSMMSLRKHYAGPITILSEGEESHPYCERIGKALGVRVKRWESGVSPGKNAAFLAKTLLNQGTPYDITLAIDSDTLILGAIEELFDAAEKGSFCVAHFANRLTTRGVLNRRLRRWADIAQSDLEAAIRFGPAINTGVMAFTKDASIFQEWYTLAEKGRHHFIPDEVSCQLLLHRHKHQIVDGRWNRSCKHDNPDLPDTKIIHYHGKKHCRDGLPFHGRKWVMAFQEAYRANTAEIRSWAPAGDIRLEKFLRRHSKKGNEQSEKNRQTVPGEVEALRIVLGAGRTNYPGWRSTDRNELNITRERDFRRILERQRADRFLAEHVWEHLKNDEVTKANALAFKFLKPGGLLRIAVPDGLHPDSNYLDHVKPNGSGPSAQDHHQLFNHRTLTASLEATGFVVKKLEYWDETRTFHCHSWNPLDGHVKRSSKHDRRNREKPLSYTSLIVDAYKPRLSI